MSDGRTIRLVARYFDAARTVVDPAAMGVQAANVLRAQVDETIRDVIHSAFEAETGDPEARKKINRYFRISRGNTHDVEVAMSLIHCIGCGRQAVRLACAVRRYVDNPGLDLDTASIESLRMASESGDVDEEFLAEHADEWLVLSTEALRELATALQSEQWHAKLDVHCQGAAQRALDWFRAEYPVYGARLTAVDLQPIVATWARRPGRTKGSKTPGKRKGVRSTTASKWTHMEIALRKAGVSVTSAAALERTERRHCGGRDQWLGEYNGTLDELVAFLHPGAAVFESDA